MLQNLHCSYAGCTVYNLGTGRGTSVLEMIAAFERAAGMVNTGLCECR